MSHDQSQSDAGQARRRSLIVWIAVATLLVAGAVILILVLIRPGLAARSGGLAFGWLTSTPDEQSMDSGKLEAMMTYIDEHDMAVDAIVVVRHGRIVFEEYGPGYARGRRHKLYSVTKSVMSMLVGIAIDQGLFEGVHVPLTELFPGRSLTNLDDRKARITLEHLLAMSDGMAWYEQDWPYEDPRNTVNQMWSSADVVQFVLDRPMAREPGEAWAYNSGASILLGGALEEATGRDLAVFAREVLFDPVGVGTVYWEEAPGGHYYTDGGLHMTPRDMARLGYLMLHKGLWDGRQVVPADWVACSTRVHAEASGTQGYGYQWWIPPGGEGYMAGGLYDQRIMILPRADMVVVFTANIPDPALYHVDGLVSSFILPACTDLDVTASRATYDAHGFTFEYPGDFLLEEGPIPGHPPASDASGVVQITSMSEPRELVLVVWHEAEEGVDAPAFLEAYLTGLAETGMGVAPGESRTGQKDGHPMALRFSELTLEGGTLNSVSGAWVCDAAGRAFAVTYLTTEEMAPAELLTAFEGYLKGLTCH